MFVIFIIVSLVSLHPLLALCTTELWTRRGTNSVYRTGWSRYDTLLFIGKAEKPASRGEPLSPTKVAFSHIVRGKTPQNEHVPTQEREGWKEGIHELEVTYPAHPLYKTLNGS